MKNPTIRDRDTIIAMLQQFRAAQETLLCTEAGSSKQRSSVDDIYTELDWLKKYLVERDIWDSACWAHYTRLRALCATWIPKPKRQTEGAA